MLMVYVFIPIYNVNVILPYNICICAVTQLWLHTTWKQNKTKVISKITVS